MGSHYYKRTREHALENLDRRRLLLEAMIASVLVPARTEDLLDQARQALAKHVDHMILSGS